MSQSTNPVKKFGGRQSTSGANACGSGLVFEIRTALGMTQAEMADALAISPRTLQRIEAAGETPTNRLQRAALLSLVWRMDAGEARTRLLEALQ